MVDTIVKESFYEIALKETGEPVEKAFKEVQKPLWIGRGIQLTAFAISAYALAIFAMRPLKKSAEMQKHFVATASHQLRTPLAVMQSGLEVTLRNPELITQGKVINILRDNLEETKRLSNIIKFLLTFSRLESQRSSLITENVHIKKTVDEVLALLSDFAKEKNITIKKEFTCAPIITGNEVAIYELIANLIKNAILYTHKNGLITINLQSTNKGPQLSISDNGKGISKSDLPHIFQPFYQGHAGRDTDARGGVGLGLAIAQDIARLHNSNIEVESTEGKGTKFSIVFHSYNK